MNQGDQNQYKGDKLLEENEVGLEINYVIEHNLLPQRIAQKVGEKLKEKNIKVTKEQLYRLIEKIQNALQTYAPQTFNQLKKVEFSQITRDEKKSNIDSMIQTTDMKKLLDNIDQLNLRLKNLEERQIHGVKGVSGKLVQTKDIKTLDPEEVVEVNMEPLEHIPSDPESIVVIMKFLQHLVDKTGKNNLPDVLGYYVDIGWISDDVRLDLIGYSKGIIEETTATTSKTSHLPTRDHLQSLLFIQRLKGTQLDERFLSKIERDMEKMTKSLEGYPLK
jgi:archaeal flagellar protein FlaD